MSKNKDSIYEKQITCQIKTGLLKGTDKMIAEQKERIVEILMGFLENIPKTNTTPEEMKIGSEIVSVAELFIVVW